MSAPFATTLRSRPGAIRLGTGDEQLITLRVEIPEVWDTVRFQVPADLPVAVLKERALGEMMPDAEHPEDFVVKLGGWEVLDEQLSVTAAGATQGSIFLLTSRRRRPVR